MFWIISFHIYIEIEIEIEHNYFPAARYLGYFQCFAILKLL